MFSSTIHTSSIQPSRHNLIPDRHSGDIYTSNVFDIETALAFKTILGVCRHADSINAGLGTAFVARHRDYYTSMDLDFRVMVRYLFSLFHNTSPYLQARSKA